MQGLGIPIGQHISLERHQTAQARSDQVAGVRARAKGAKVGSRVVGHAISRD